MLQTKLQAEQDKLNAKEQKINDLIKLDKQQYVHDYENKKIASENYQAGLDYRKAIEVAELSSQTTITSQQMKAASDAANMQNDGQDTSETETSNAAIDTVEPVETDKTVQMQATLQAMQEQNAAVMDRMTQALEAMSKPKTLTMKAPSGTTYTGVVN